MKEQKVEKSLHIVGDMINASVNVTERKLYFSKFKDHNQFYVSLTEDEARTLYEELGIAIKIFDDEYAFD